MDEPCYTILVGQHGYETDGTLAEETGERSMYLVAGDTGAEETDIGLYTTAENAADELGRQLDRAVADGAEPVVTTPSEYGDTIETPTDQEFTIQDLPDDEYDAILQDAGLEV